MPIPKRASGGKQFLQQEVGVLADVLLHTFDGTTADGRTYVRLSVEVVIQREGVVEPIQQFLHGGYLSPGMSVSEDGKALLGVSSYAVDPGTEWGKFVISLFENPEGVTKQRLPEELYGTGTRYDAWIGTKCLFDRVVDKEATARRGPEISKTTGQSFDRRQLVVLEVLALPGKLVKGTRKVNAAVPGKPVVTVPVATDDADVEALDRVLAATLANLPNAAINRKGLGTAFLKLSSKLGQTGAARDVPRKVFADDNYLLSAVDRGVIEFDGSDDGQITLLTTVTA